MRTYEIELAKYQSLFDQASKRFNILSTFRLLVGIAAVFGLYQYIRNREMLFGLATFACIVLFLVLVRWHARVTLRKQFYQQLIQINEREIAALSGDFSGFGAGEQYVDPQHDYSFDLDVFGKNSLYQYLNRSANQIGADRLAAYFLHAQPKADILATQEAVRALAPNLSWRQEFLATGQIHADEKGAYRRLLQWAEIPVRPTPLALRLLWYALSLGTVMLALVSFFYPVAGMGNYLQALAGLNLVLVLAHFKKIKAELQHLNAIFKAVASYGYLLQQIEKEDFKSIKIEKIKNGLFTEGQAASQAVLELSRLLDRLESVQNLFAAVIVNSLFLYHIHVLLALEKWKLRYAAQIKNWMEGVGEMEALSSLAHFSYNNPDFVFPEITEKAGLDMADLGHPLIPQSQRVCNSIRYEQPGFVVLTGSNMSGKSTFLRTLGLNLLLAKTGAPVCASRCSTFPFDIFVCMKLSDSLHDNESYFYAELKRLHRIIKSLESGPPGFVLLDEVLRGTNSNDKLSGTLGLVETMLRVNATGILATHDLNVCQTPV